jgi:nicotinate-nucleotide adenylyltransferase
LKPYRIGVFGGTFDPVHLGHLQLAQKAIDSLLLDRLLFVPAAQPPHKLSTITPIVHRMKMLQLVCDKNDRFECSDIETRLPTPSYTVDTLKALKAVHHSETLLYFILGVDAFLDFKTWKSYETILQLVNIAISPRVGYLETQLHRFLIELGYNRHNSEWTATDRNRNIILLPQFPVGICSSAVRKTVAKGMAPKDSLPLEVGRYIEENCLYKQ